MTSGGGTASAPVSGSVITCDTTAPNPETTPVGSGGVTDNVTLNILPGATVNGGSSSAASLGSMANVTVGGELVSSGKVATALNAGDDLTLLLLQGGRIEGTTDAGAVSAGNRANITVAGDMVAAGKAGIAAGDDLTLLLLNSGTIQQTGSSTAVSAGLNANITVGGTISANSGTAIASGDNLTLVVLKDGIIQQQAGGASAITAGANAQITVGGTISAPSSNAIEMGADGKLTLLSTYNIIGNVVTTSPDTYTLALGGNDNGTFDVSGIGPAAQFQSVAQLIKEGGSTWIVTGTSDFSGPTSVQAGELAVNGSLANSAVTVANGAVLSGIGTIGSLVAQGGSTVAPGSGGIGTLNIAGNVGFDAGSVYRVKVNAAGEADRIAAAGTATLSGGTVSVLANPGEYNPSTAYTILIANGGVTGTFAGVTSDMAFLTPSLGYDTNSVTLTLVRKVEPVEPDTPDTPPAPTPVAFNSVTVTPNQFSTATAVEALGAGNPLFDIVLQQNVSGARQAFDALSGEAHASTATTGYSSAQQVQNTVLGRLRQPLIETVTVPAAFAADLPGVAPAPVPVVVPSFDPRRFALWGEGFGSWGKVDSNGNAAGMDTSTGGFILGADATLDHTFRVGVAGGFSRTTFDIDGRLSSGSNESIFGTLYGAGSWGGLNLRLGTSLAAHDFDVERTVLFPGFADRTGASYDGWSAQAFGELGYRFQFGLAALEPFVGASVLRLHTDSFVEDGGAAALTGFSQTYDLGTTTVGIRAEAQVSPEVPLIVRGMVGWRHTYGDVEPSALMAFSNGASAFTVAGVPVDRDALVAEAGLDWQATQDVSFGVAYQGQVGSQAQEHALKGNFTWKF